MSERLRVSCRKELSRFAASAACFEDGNATVSAAVPANRAASLRPTFLVTLVALHVAALQMTGLHGCQSCQTHRCGGAGSAAEHESSSHVNEYSSIGTHLFLNGWNACVMRRLYMANPAKSVRKAL